MNVDQATNDVCCYILQGYFKRFENVFFKNDDFDIIRYMQYVGLNRKMFYLLFIISFMQFLFYLFIIFDGQSGQ